MSGLPHVEREINGTTYRAHVLTLDHWAELTELLAGVLGDPLASLLRGDAAFPAGQDPSLRRGEVEGLIAGLAGRLSARTILSLARVMGQSLHAGGRPLTPDKQKMWWPAHMRDLAPVVRLFLEAQYADFYEGLSDSLPQEPPAAGDLSDGVSGSSDRPSP